VAVRHGTEGDSTRASAGDVPAANDDEDSCREEWSSGLARGDKPLYMPSKTCCKKLFRAGVDKSSFLVLGLFFITSFFTTRQDEKNN
jgi:hypothetical protein